jgi:hypothetical protein
LRRWTYDIQVTPAALGRHQVGLVSLFPSFRTPTVAFYGDGNGGGRGGDFADSIIYIQIYMVLGRGWEKRDEGGDEDRPFAFFVMVFVGINPPRRSREAGR